MVVLGSQRASIENKGFFASRVRKFKKMTVFDSWTCELAQRLENKRKSRLFRRLAFSGRNECAIYERMFKLPFKNSYTTQTIPKLL